MSNSTDTRNNTLTAIALIVIVVIAVVYFVFIYLKPQFDYETKRDEASQLLMQKSSAHKVLVQNYMNCRTNSWRNSTRAQCIKTIRELSESEGLQDQFEQVHLDIKNNLWKIK